MPVLIRSRRDHIQYSDFIAIDGEDGAGNHVLAAACIKYRARRNGDGGEH